MVGVARKNFKAAIFDLDGVLVDTARYHYLAWRKLAASLGFDFSEADNERLKGVSRVRSLEILLEVGGLSATNAGKERMAALKNRWYVELISKLDASALLPGALECLKTLQQADIPLALASASKNAGTVVERLQIWHLFRYIVDATAITRAKPDPEAFLNAADGLAVSPTDAVVFEDAAAGIDAAHAAGMYAVGIGDAKTLGHADMVVPDLAHFDVWSLFNKE